MSTTEAIEDYVWITEPYSESTSRTIKAGAKSAASGNYQIAQELFDKGLIFLVNAAVLHHFGYALGVTVGEDGETVIGLNLHKTSDADGIWFGEEETVRARRKFHAAYPEREDGKTKDDPETVTV
jgi:hypothetical protein